MIAWEAINQFSAFRSATAAGNPARTRPSGSGSIITPVENGSTWRLSQPSNRAISRQVARASAIPRSPVPALALPVLTTSARIGYEASRFSRCSLAMITGAAQKSFCVKTPATFAPSCSLITSRSRRPGFLMPASATPKVTPSIGSNCSGTGGVKLTGINRNHESLMKCCGSQSKQHDDIISRP